ncbi:MAG: right-handed parallel beta-helix repeat-containing protein, partial [Pseudomonadota bacterium]
MAVTFEVSNVNELMSALASASGGDTISLAAANYGYVQFTGQNFNSEVRIVSADADNPAQFDRIEFESSSNITLDSIKVAFPSNGGQGTRVVNINNSSDISIVDSEVHGRVDGTYEGFGIRVKDSSGILIDNNFVHNVMNGIAVFSADSVTVSENYIDYVGADFMKGGGLTDFVYANNIGGGNLFPSPTAHADFIQFQGSSYDGVISGNVFLSQTSERAQGIFMSNGTYGNVLVEQNILYTGKANGIKIFGEGGIVVRNNTVLSTPDAGHESSYVSLPNGGVSENNIYTVDFDAGTKGSNLIVQHSKSNGVNFYGDVFVDAMGGVGDISLEGLMPAPGSPAEGKGAYERLLQLLGEDSSYVAPPVPPAPSDDPGTDEAEAPTDPVPFPEPIEGSVFSMVGALVVSGAQDVVEVAHSAEFELASSTLALSFNADTTSGRKGIFTKDASGGGDHVAVYIENGTLYVRVQDGGKQVVLTEGNIGTGRDYDLHVVFGGGNVVALLDGEVIGEAATGMSWADNAEVMQIGGLGWASNSGQAGFGNPFDGTISDVVVVEGKPGWDAVEAIRFGEPLPDTDPDPDPDDVPQPAPLPDPPDDGDEPPAPDEDLVPIFGFDGALEITGPADVLEIAHGE